MAHLFVAFNILTHMGLSDNASVVVSEHCHLIISPHLTWNATLEYITVFVFERFCYCYNVSLTSVALV